MRLFPTAAMAIISKACSPENNFTLKNQTTCFYISIGHIQDFNIHIHNSSLKMYNKNNTHIQPNFMRERDQ